MINNYDLSEKTEYKIIETSKINYNGILFEQIYNSQRKTSYYMGWNKEKQESITLDYIIDNNLKYLPIKDELLEKGAVILPDTAIDYNTIDELELEIDCFIKTWLDVSDEFRQKSTWYILLTWVIDKLHTIPYLRALGDYGTGKTRYLDVIGGLCYKPMYVGGAVRSAPIYRVIDKWRGTAIFDEFTLKKSDETEDIIQILNNGYQRGKPVLRCADGGNYDKVKVFDPFGAKLLATRDNFKDTALESRCITEIMKMTTRSDLPVDFTSHFYEKRQELQNKLLMYRFKNWESINPDESIKIDFGNILPRIKQSLTPFTVLFQNNADRLTSFIKYTQEYNNRIIEENSNSLDGQIFNQYLQLLEQHEEEQITLDDYYEPVITSTDIKKALIEDGWKEDSITSNFIGKRLHNLGFKTKPKKIAGKTKKMLIINDELLKILKTRYVVTTVTRVTTVTGTSDKINNRSNEND